MPIDASTCAAGGQVLRLLQEAGQPILIVDLHDAEAAAPLPIGISITPIVAAAPRSRWTAQHPRVVHLVDVIAREHDQVPRILAQDRVEVLVDRVGGAEIPVLADALLRAEDLDELAELVGDDAPAHADVAAERERLVLQRDEDLAQARS